MLLPLIVAVVAVVLGAWLALGLPDGTRFARPIRVVALVAALFVIVIHLLPEAFHELGLRAVLGFAAGVAVPRAMEVASSVFAKRRHTHDGRGAVVAIEFGYAGLVVHRFGDGLSMGALAGTNEALWPTLLVLLAFAAHIVPVTAAMILAVESVRGRAAAVVHSVGLAVSTSLGVLAAALAIGGGAGASGSVRASVSGSVSLSPWVSAVVAGLLLHIVVHDAPRARGAHDAHGADGANGDGTDAKTPRRRERGMIDSGIL